MDKDPRHCEALRKLRTDHPARQIDILEGDSNSAIKEVVQGSSWNGIRAVMFLDPYGMSVDWETLESIRATEAIDVWYLVPSQGSFDKLHDTQTRLTNRSAPLSLGCSAIAIGSPPGTRERSRTICLALAIWNTRVSPTLKRWNPTSGGAFGSYSQGF
jgi:three-Cys-motif partner protein